MPGLPNESAEGLIEGILQRGVEPTRRDEESWVLLTFLFADIRGYTKFTEERGDGAAAKLTAKFAVIVRELIGQFGGTVFELRGDEAMCVFSSPRQSLRLAVALQERFVAATAEDPDLPLTVGIGVDAGEAVRGPDGYRGGALNLAARLCARARSGEVLVSPEVTHLVGALDGIRYRVLDRVTVKGLDEPIRPVRVLPSGADPAQQLTTLLAASMAPARPVSAVSRLPGPLARRPRATVIGAALLAATVAAAAAIVIVHGEGGGATGLSALDENSLGIIDAHNGRIIDQVPVGAGPVAAAAGFGSVWTANADDDSVSRVDTKTHQVTAIPVGSAPSAIAAGEGSVWVTNSNASTVTRIDPDTNASHAIPVGNTPAGVAVGHGSVWVTNSQDGTVSRIDPALNKAVDSIDVGDNPRGISAGRDIWVANSASNSVSKINGGGRTNAVTATINVGAGPLGIAVVDATVWVTNMLDSNISRIPTSASAVLDTVELGPEPAQLGAVGGHVWIVMQASRRIVELAPSSHAVERSVAIGSTPGGLVAAAGKLWVTATANPALHRGGTLNLTGDDIGSVDPTYLNWPSQGALLANSYDGLVGFRHAGGVDGTAIVPDLATALPEPTNGGRTYTFHLRDGVRWSTGRPVTVFDMRRGIERAMVFYPPVAKQIVGGNRCRPSRCDVRGLSVDAATRSVTIHLVRPNGTFINDIGLAIAVPADTPLAEDRSRIVAATGPYRVARYVPRKLVVLTRNRYFHEWSAVAQPDGFPDRIEYRIDPKTKRAVAEVASGHSDWADATYGARFGELEARFRDRLHVTPELAMYGLFLNTQIPPFDDARVRRALAYALDRGSVVGSYPLPGSVTCQFVPSGYPGYRPYCPYTLRPDATGVWKGPDLARAEDLVRTVKTRGVVTLHAPDEKTAAAFGPVLDALRFLGYRPHIAVFKGALRVYLDYVADSRRRIQAGFFGWVMSGASLAEYFSAWGCETFVPADGPRNPNPSEFCDPAIDRLRQRAERAQVSSPTAADALWAEIDRQLVRSAPWIPLIHPVGVDVVSKRVHNFKLNPFIGALYDQMWVR